MKIPHLLHHRRQYELSQAALDLIAEEELNGAVVSNHFRYIFAIIIGYFIITWITLAWFKVTPTDNFAFVIKNPTLMFLILPLVITIFQFKIRLVVFAVSLFLAIYFSLIG